MALEYKLYCIDGDGRVTARHDYSASDDLASLDVAKELCRQDEIEVWQGSRLVARVKPDGTASFAATAEPHAA